jgi:hypothetical protein
VHFSFERRNDKNRSTGSQALLLFSLHTSQPSLSPFSRPRFLLHPTGHLLHTTQFKYLLQAFFFNKIIKTQARKNSKFTKLKANSASKLKVLDLLCSKIFKIFFINWWFLTKTQCTGSTEYYTIQFKNARYSRVGQ